LGVSGNLQDKRVVSRAAVTEDFKKWGSKPQNGSAARFGGGEKEDSPKKAGGGRDQKGKKEKRGGPAVKTVLNETGQLYGRGGGSLQSIELRRDRNYEGRETKVGEDRRTKRWVCPWVPF